MEMFPSSQNEENSAKHNRFRSIINIFLACCIKFQSKALRFIVCCCGRHHDGPSMSIRPSVSTTKSARGRWHIGWVEDEAQNILIRSVCLPLQPCPLPYRIVVGGPGFGSVRPQLPQPPCLFASPAGPAMHDYTIGMVVWFALFYYYVCAFLAE